MSTKDKLNINRKDMLWLDSNAVEVFKATVENAVPYKVQDKEQELKVTSDLAELKLKKQHNIDRES